MSKMCIIDSNVPTKYTIMYQILGRSIEVLANYMTVIQPNTTILVLLKKTSLI
jgi:hypothetical protein